MKWKLNILIGVALVVAFFLVTPTVVRRQKISALAAYERELVAHGEKLTPVEIAPHFNDEEVAAARRFQSSAVQLSYRNLPLTAKIIAPGHALTCWKESSLPSENTSNLWDGLRLEISARAAMFEALRAVSKEPPGGINLDYSLGSGLMLTHLAPMKNVAVALSAATVLELHDGHPAQAWENLMACVRVSDAGEREPLFISQLVHVAMIAIAANATWEALQYPDWSDAQLAELQQAWVSIDVVSAVQPALAMERSMQTLTFDFARQDYTNLV